MNKPAKKGNSHLGGKTRKAQPLADGTEVVHWLDLLGKFLRQRQIGKGFELLDETEPQWSSLQVPGRSSAELVLELTQWVDVGYRDHQFLRKMLDMISPEARLELGVKAYVRVRMAEAFYALAVDDADNTIRTLDIVLRLDRELLEADLKTLAHLWKGRAHRKKADYKMAFEHIEAARELACDLPDSKALVAVIQVQQAWLIFQQGDFTGALKVLDEAEQVLQLTDHWISLGNIESARGRIIRRRGDYVKALQHFQRAVDFYEARHPNHPNLARAVTNMAFVKRVLALQLKRHIDSSASRRGSAGTGENSDRTRLRPLHKQYQELYRSAIAGLEHAKRICILHDHHGGLATALLNAGYLHLDVGELDLANSEATEAYAIAEITNSIILKARAKDLSGLIENAHVEELLGHPEDAPAFARRARQDCMEAVSLAEGTQNKRLLLNAQLALGEVAINNFFHDYDVARRCVDCAAALIEPNDADYVVDDLNTLRAKLLRTVGIDDTLRAWSQGIVSGKTLQEITEEFAELFVIQVWLREDRKISRVAKQLTMSPKKVRRLIRRAGLTASSETSDEGMKDRW